MTNRNREVGFLGLFFVSGACGLIYEIVWSRLLVFVFGGTTFAITTVLGCFMGGLALGSHVAGRISPRVGRPARLYGMLEITVGLYCILIPFLLDLAFPMYKALAGISGGSFFWLTLARVLVCAAVLIIPTAMMGATLPLLSKAFARRSEELGGAVARLYGINTVGAFVGCTAAGFFLLPVLGLSKSILLAAAMNIGAGLLAIRLSSQPVSVEASAPKKPSKPKGAPPPRLAGTYEASLAPQLLLWLYGLSGFAAMAYQVAWTRALILSLGASTYAFSAIVACFIFGIAAGSLLISPWIHRIRAPLALAGALEVLIGLSALIVVPFFGEVPGMVARMSANPATTFEQIMATEILSVFGLLIVPTLCMGALMPLLCAIYESMRGSQGEATTGKSVASVYASNTVGTIIGAVAAGFLLIPLPQVGMQKTIMLASAASGIIGTAFVLGEKRWRTPVLYGVLGVTWVGGIIFAAALQPWSKRVMISGPYMGRSSETVGSIVYYREGIDTTVSVTATGTDGLTLRVNGKPDASNGYTDRPTQFLSGHLPLLMKPNAREVCVIGVGSGATVGAVLAHEVEWVDAVEISAAVVEAARFFHELNNDCLDDPRLAMHQADGRNFLLMTDRTYDAIVSEPSNPWISGIANLFTREFFELAKSRLKPGGLHCQWLQSYSTEVEDFASVLRTVSEVFSHVQLWEMGFHDYLIVGSDEPIVLDIEDWHFTFQRPDVRSTMAAFMIHDPLQLANHYIADGDHLADMIAQGRILTDDVPHLEFSAPRNLRRFESGQIANVLANLALEPTLAEDTAPKLAAEFIQRIRGAREAREALAFAEGGGQFQMVLEAFGMMASRVPNDLRMLLYIDQELAYMTQAADARSRPIIAAAHAAMIETAPALEFVRRWNAGDDVELPWPLGPGVPAAPDPAELLQAGRDAVERGDAEAAIPPLLTLWMLTPEDATAGFQLARAYAMRGQHERALAALEDAVDRGFARREEIELSEVGRALGENARFRALLERIPTAP